MLQPVDGSWKLFECPNLCRGKVKVYVYDSAAAIDVMFHPVYAGMRLAEQMKKAAIDFWLAFFWREISADRPLPRVENLVEYILLTGGRYYFLRDGLYNLARSFNNYFALGENWQRDYVIDSIDEWFGRDQSKSDLLHEYLASHFFDIQQIYLGVWREEIHDGVFTANNSYKSIEFVPDEGIVVSGDTIASGITGIESIKFISNYYLMKNKSVDRMLINSVFASEYGVRQIVDFAVNTFPDLRLDIFVSGALLDMDEKNKTDLWFFRNGRWQVKRIEQSWPDFPVVYYLLECLTDDWGRRNKHPRLYLAKRKAEFEGWLTKLNQGFAAEWLTADLWSDLIKNLTIYLVEITGLLK